MQFAVLAPAVAGTTADPAWMSGFARHAERCGFESVVAVEHAVVVNDYASAYPYDASGRMELGPECDIPDPLDLLAYLAGCTSRIGLATGVLVLPVHHPVVLAKRAATIDALSGGRLRLCVGVGWMREEVEACGVDFATRGRRADESIDVMRTLWAGDGDGVRHDGEFFRFDAAVSRPRPARAGGVPIHVGGHSAAAARRAGRRGDGFQPLGLVGEDLRAALKLMRAEAEQAGRDPDAIEVTLGHTASKVTGEKAERLRALGADRILLAVTPTADLPAVHDELSACAERLGLAAAAA